MDVSQAAPPPVREVSPGNRGLLIALLGALTALAPVTIDMYAPGFPRMSESLHASDTAVQLSMTAFLIGLAVGQLLLGPLSDGLGRRRILAGGGLAYVAFLLAGGGGVAATWTFLAVILAGIGMATPAATTIGQVLGRDSAGSASALLGGLPFLLGAAASPLVGAAGAHSALPMALIMLTALCCAALSLACLARPWQGRGEPHTLPSRQTAALTKES
jgi:MFS family permease